LMDEFSRRSSSWKRSMASTRNLLLSLSSTGVCFSRS
jgi:hypothetical protein